MKIVALLEGAISAGGGFNQALNAIVQMARLSEGNFEFSVLTSQEGNVATLERLGIVSQFYRLSFLDKLMAILAMNEFTKWIALRMKLSSPIEKKLETAGCDIVYFVEPTVRAATLQRLNYIITVWDNCHRDFPEFPEVRFHNEFHRREFLYKNYLPPAYLVLVDSEALRDLLHNRYGVDKERMLVMPFAPNPMLEAKNALSVDEVLAHYRLDRGYFFYPAQFWAHKNHVRILEAMATLRERNKIYHLVLVGGDQGNLAHIHKVVSKLGLHAEVFILGFVPSEHLRGLYLGSRAVIMPTYFGPTNIPPLEAWQLGRPLIYSEHLGEQCGEAAILINPDESNCLADAMSAICEQETSTTLCKLGLERLRELESVRYEAEAKLSSRLRAFGQRRATWAL